MKSEKLNSIHLEMLREKRVASKICEFHDIEMHLELDDRQTHSNSPSKPTFDIV